MQQNKLYVCKLEQSLQNVEMKIKTLREGFKTSLSLGTGGILGLAGTAVQNLVDEKKSSVDIKL